MEASENGDGTWQEVAKQKWNLAFPGVSAVVEACLQSTDKWVVIGALLSGQARVVEMGEAWQNRLEQIAASEDDTVVSQTAKRLLGDEVEQLHQSLSLTEIMLFLKRIPLYNSMSLDQLNMISTNLIEHDVQREEVIFREDDPTYELYLIVAGNVKIVKQLEGEEHTLVTLAAGDFFGDMAIFENRPRSAGAVAVEDGVLLVLSPERFRHIILQEPAISFEIFRELSARLRRFDQDTSEATC